MDPRVSSCPASGLGQEHGLVAGPQQPGGFRAHRHGSHQTEAPYSLITRSAHPAP